MGQLDLHPWPRLAGRQVHVQSILASRDSLAVAQSASDIQTIQTGRQVLVALGISLAEMLDVLCKL